MLDIRPSGDTGIVMTRTFAAPRALVFEAWTVPNMLRRWLGVRDGWRWTACEVDLRVGGRYRYVWRDGDGGELGVGGVFEAIEAPLRVSCSERFDQAWYAGEAHITHELTEARGVTTSTTTMRYESQAARDAVLASPMASGFERGFARLDQLLAWSPTPQLDEPELREVEAERTAVVHLRIPAAASAEEFPRAVQELLAAMNAQGIAPAGPLFSHHLRWPGAEFDFEIGFPVAQPIAPVGRVRAGALPEARVVRSVYRGGFEGLAWAWREFERRFAAPLAAAGLQRGDSLWERYLRGPEASADPNDWRTELVVPLAPAT